MRKEEKYFLVFFILGCFFISCEKKSATPASSVPKDKSVLKVTGWFNYTPSASYKEDILFIYGSYIGGPITNDPTISYVKLSFYTRDTGTFILSTKNYGYIASGWYYENIRTAFQTDSVYAGSVYLTTFDTIHHLASGTFKFAGGALNPYLGPPYDSCSGYFSNLTW